MKYAKGRWQKWARGLSPQVGTARGFYCYSLIYFIVRDDTYVVSSIFTCLMTIGGFAARVRILLEKGPSRHHISKIKKFPEK
jgi:hypothetical protein